MDDISEKEKEVKLKESKDSSGDSDSTKNLSTGGSQNGEKNQPDSLPELGDDYEVLGFIGKGGMGAVYKVKDKVLDKVLAIKLMQKELADDAAALKRFEQESDAASKLSHPNLVSVYKHGKTKNGEPFLVMDYLEGKSLSDLIDEKKHLSDDKVLDIFIQVCDALEHAHKNGVLHRDIKPTNIILTQSEEGKEVAKIVDFGIAKVMNASTRETHDLTQTGEVFGSPHYMSPEQCLGFMLKEHSDIYSLGCSLYESITGSPPFGGSNPIQLVVKHINDPVAGFDREFKTNKKFKQLETVTLKCLEKEPVDRFQSVSDLKADLEKIKEGKSIPLYAVKTKAKPTLTKRQALVVGALIIGSIVYISITSRLTPSNIGNQIAMGVTTLIFGASFTALLLVGVDKLKGVLSDKRSAQNWWLMLLSLLGGAAGLVMIPNMLVSVFYFATYNSPLWAQQISDTCTAIHALIMILVTAAGLGFLTFRKLKEANARYIFTRFSIILFLLVSTPLVLIPDQASKLTKHLSEHTSKTLPNVSEYLLELTTKLQSKPDYTIRNLAEIQYENGQKEKAYNTMKNAIAITKDKALLSNFYETLASFYSKDKNYQEAIATINKAIAINIDKDTGEPSNDYLLTRARYLFKMGETEKALADIDKYISTHAGNSSAFDLKAAIKVSQNNYEEAIDILDNAITTHSSSVERHLLKGILLEKVGEAAQAKKEFGKVLTFNKWMQEKDSYYDYYQSALCIAYAQLKLGNIKMSNHILDQIKEHKKIEKEKLEELLSIAGTNIKLDW